MLNNLMSSTFNGELTAGEHKTTIKSWEYKAHESDPAKDYLRITFATENCGKQQDFFRNFFERDVSIAISHIRRQLKRNNEDIVPNTFFDELVANATPLSFWVSYPTVATKRGMQRKQNIHFIAPSEIDETEAADMDMPV